ncbi:hypothetical protein C5Z25_10660 [Lactobacillus sp. CBA3605]|uniref:hypothetical protein n=1 Tax=Lactobacillus sp. CBA3605 TaxID=2099788 RepID=UPI000CFDBD14|nr:hypothetical protein [Lactobacillus sp. CBA3605]AVK62207.1 hypothetical protein C5Z25_10660 [Lactobacillus sp. CBA3605]
MKFIQYNLSGKIVEQYSCDFDQLTDNPIGEKVKVTMDDGKMYIGFFDTFIGQGIIQAVEISQYDLDEETSKLRSFNSIVTFVPTNRITKLEAILHSNPRWGIRPTNKFEFSKPVKIELDQFKNWPTKNSTQPK